MPSVAPVWIGTRVGEPLRSTTAAFGAAAYESAEFGISTAPVCCSVTMVTVAVMLGSRVTSVLSTEIRAL